MSQLSPCMVPVCQPGGGTGFWGGVAGLSLLRSSGQPRGCWVSGCVVPSPAGPVEELGLLLRGGRVCGDRVVPAAEWPPPGLAMTVLSAGGERPRQGWAWGLLHTPPPPPNPHPPTSLHVARNAPAAGAGVSRSPRAVSTRGDSPSGTACHVPQPLAQTRSAAPGAGSGPAEGLQRRCEEGEDGVSHGLAWGTTGSPAAPAPSSRDLYGRAFLGANSTRQNKQDRVV